MDAIGCCILLVAAIAICADGAVRCGAAWHYGDSMGMKVSAVIAIAALAAAVAIWWTWF